MSDTELKELIADLVRSQKETDRQLKETDQQLKETDQQLKESSRDTDKRIKELSTLFTGQWGKLVESLLVPGLPGLFREWGIAVHKASTLHKIYDDEGIRVAEFDLFLCNGTEDVAVEVKTTLRPKDIDEHLERLRRIRDLRPEYATAQKQLYGAVAALQFDAASDTYAERQGLFVLQCTESIVKIANEKNFAPKGS